jgi:hypothetical protein
MTSACIAKIRPMGEQQAKSKRLPMWAEEPLTTFRQDLGDWETLLSAAVRGIFRQVQEPFEVDWLERYQDIEVKYEGATPEPEEAKERRRTEAKARAAFAESERNDDYPRLHAFGALTIYSTLEAMVQNVLVGYLANESAPRQLDVVKAVRLSIAAEKERRSGSQRTVQSYSRMLRDFFGRTGKTPDEISSQDVFTWAYGIGLSGKQPSSITIGARLACVSSFYRFLLRMKVVPSNPCDALDRPGSSPASRED